VDQRNTKGPGASAEGTLRRQVTKHHCELSWYVLMQMHQNTSCG
jgi:hypothetical protein